MSRYPRTKTIAFFFPGTLRTPIPTRMGAAAREQLRGASAVDSRTDEPRCRALHGGQHSRANAREREQMCGDSSSGGAHFSMCTFDRAECMDGSVLAAGGAAIRDQSGGAASVEVLSTTTVFQTGTADSRIQVVLRKSCRFDLAVRWRRRFCDGIWWWMRAYEAQ